MKTKQRIITVQQNLAKLFLCLVIIFFVNLLAYNISFALPEVGEVVAGSATINTDSSTNTMTIIAGPQTIINYNSFNIFYVNIPPHT